MSDLGARVSSWARTRYYRVRFRKYVIWGARVQVRGRLRLRGPGRIVIEDDCVLGGGSANNAIHAGESSVTVRLGRGCNVYSVNIAANEDVTIGAEVHVRSLLFLDRPGRMDVGDGCDIDALDIVATEEVTIGARVQVRARLHMDGPGRIVIGEDCVFGDGSGNNAIHAVEPATTVRIGRGCYVNGLDVFATEDVTVGERCKVGSCSMVTTDFHSTHRDRWSPDVHAKSGPISLGENVWVASNTIITKGVSIGDNSVVSIGTVVRDDVPANVIVSSHHQRVVKELPS